MYTQVELGSLFEVEAEFSRMCAVCVGSSTPLFVTVLLLKF